MEYQHPDLIKVMDQIKTILAANDVAATVILAMPEPDQTSKTDFHILTYHHIEISYSCAKIVKEHCCPEHGMADGILVELNKQTGESAAKIVKSTTGMFNALFYGTGKAQKHYMAAIVGIKKMVERIAVKNLVANKTHLN